MPRRRPRLLLPALADASLGIAGAVLARHLAARSAWARSTTSSSGSRRRRQARRRAMPAGGRLDRARSRRSSTSPRVRVQRHASSTAPSPACAPRSPRAAGTRPALRLRPLDLPGLAARRTAASILVNRGFVPESRLRRDQAGEPGPVEVTGFLRAPETRDSFTPADDPGQARVLHARSGRDRRRRSGLTAPRPSISRPTPGRRADAAGRRRREGADRRASPNNHLQLCADLVRTGADAARRVRRLCLAGASARLRA